MHKRKVYDNPTPPRKCDAQIIPESGPLVPIKCRKRVHKAGMCIDHWTEWKKAKEWRLENVTV